MAKKHIRIGDTPNDRQGDPLREAFRKVNENFDELYQAGNPIQYHLGDDVQFVDIDPDTGMVVIQSGFDTGMPVYIKGANCADEGVGGNVVIEAGGAGLPNTGTTGNIELAAQQVTIESNNNMWTFRDDGVLELPVGGIIKDSDGTSVLGATLTLQAKPTTKEGQAGDLKGMIAIDSIGGEFYYCIANYTDGADPIWAKVAGSTSWI